MAIPDWWTETAMSWFHRKRLSWCTRTGIRWFKIIIMVSCIKENKHYDNSQADWMHHIVPTGWHYRVICHKPGNTDMVYSPEKTFIQPARLGVWSGMVYPLYDDGYRIISYLAKRDSAAKSKNSPDHFHGSAYPERIVDTHLFWHEGTHDCIYWNCSAMDWYHSKFNRKGVKSRHFFLECSPEADYAKICLSFNNALIRTLFFKHQKSGKDISAQKHVQYVLSKRNVSTWPPIDIWYLRPPICLFNIEFESGGVSGEFGCVHGLKDRGADAVSAGCGRADAVAHDVFAMRKPIEKEISVLLFPDEHFWLNP